MDSFGDRDLGVFVGQSVVEEGATVLTVFHHEDGDWSFASGEEQTEADVVLVHLGHLLDADPALASLADLPRGWTAWRDDSQGEWVREPTPPDHPTLKDADVLDV